MTVPKAKAARQFEDFDAAQQEAVHSIRDFAADAVRRGGKVTGLSI